MTYTRALIENKITRPRIVLQPGQVKAVVVHYTANDDRGANAMRNRNYFNNGSPDEKGKPRPASAHYCVDSERIVQCLPGNELGYHVGDPRKNTLCRQRNRELSAGFKTPNFRTVGLEMCVNADGDFNRMRGRSISLAARLLYENDLTTRGLVRHWDVTGKICPEYYAPVGKQAAANAAAWIGFCTQVGDELATLRITNQRARVASAELNVRSGPSASADLLGTLIQNEPFIYQKSQMVGNWAEIWPGHWVNLRFTVGY